MRKTPIAAGVHINEPMLLDLQVEGLRRDMHRSSGGGVTVIHGSNGYAIGSDLLIICSDNLGPPLLSWPKVKRKEPRCHNQKITKSPFLI